MVFGLFFSFEEKNLKKIKALTNSEVLQNTFKIFNNQNIHATFEAWQMLKVIMTISTSVA